MNETLGETKKDKKMLRNTTSCEIEKDEICGQR